MSTLKIESLASSSLSYYKTLHNFEKFGEITSIDDFHKYCRWAKENKVSIYILGNGSNTLFVNNNIQSLVLKNKLPNYLKALSNNRLEVSSSSTIMEVLSKFWRKMGLYYNFTSSS